MDISLPLHNYADLIVQHGLNVQRGQIVNIAAEACHRELAFLVGEAAYRHGAGYVAIDLIEPRLHPLRVRYSTEPEMRYVPSFVHSRYQELVEKRGANLRIVGLEDPDLLSQSDPRKLNIGRTATFHALRRFYDEGIGRSKVHWTVAAAATPRWAQRLFPNLPPTEALLRLWREIFAVCRVDRADYLEAWRVHNKVLHERARRLSELQISQLHFRGPGTDLTVGLSEFALFKGGGEMGPYGVEFEPNLPTEECFTTPDWRRTAGQVRTTRPFLINGKLIKGLEARFHGGEIVEFRASEGEETFREYIASDPGARRLGEVALVGVDSPVYRSGVVFEEILFDENAACHIAIGSAYKFCLRNGDSMDAAMLDRIGCNESSAHTDMMISSEEVDVTVTCRNGNTIDLLKQGAWVW